LRVAANGYAPARDATAELGDADATATVDFTLTLGGRFRGRVLDARTRAPVGGARVALEGRGSPGDSPLQPGTQTRTNADGIFELAGLPSGPQSVQVSAEGYHERMVSGVRASAEVNAEPFVVDVSPVDSGEHARTEVVGIGVTVGRSADRMVVTGVMPGSGAAEVGISAGDQLVSVDGTAITGADMSTAIEMIRGAENTWVRIGYVRAADGSAQEQNVPRRRVAFPRE
jgi:hypothetical protein